MPKYWRKQIFSLGRFHEVGQKQKTKEKKESEKVGNNNGQLRIAAKPPGPKYSKSWDNWATRSPWSIFLFVLQFSIRGFPGDIKL